MATMKDFLESHKVSAVSEWADTNPNMNDMPAGSTHYKVRLKGTFGSKRRTLTVFFSMGPAHTKEPQAGEVLDCLASDASGFENASNFEDWASDYGYDRDSRKAERIYKAVGRNARKLKAWAGDEYEALLFDTERE